MHQLVSTLINAYLSLLGRVPVVGLLLAASISVIVGDYAAKAWSQSHLAAVPLSSLRGLLFFWFFLHTDAIARRSYCYVGYMGAFKYYRLLGDRNSSLQGDTVPNSDNRGNLRRYIRRAFYSLRALIPLMRYPGRNMVGSGGWLRSLTRLKDLNVSVPIPIMCEAFAFTEYQELPAVQQGAVCSLLEESAGHSTGDVEFWEYPGGTRTLDGVRKGLLFAELVHRLRLERSCRQEVRCVSSGGSQRLLRMTGCGGWWSTRAILPT